MSLQVANTLFLNLNDAVHAFPAEGRIQARYLRGLKGLVRTLGGDPYNLLEHHAIDPLAFDDPDHQIECASAVNLVEHCSRRLNDPLFGLHLAEQQDPDVFGCAMALARSAPTLREALQSLIDYVPFSASPECEMELVIGRQVAELRWRTNLPDGEQVHFQGLLLFVKTLQMLTGEQFRPRYASLAVGMDRSHVQTLQHRIGTRVDIRADAHAVALPVDLLDRPLATSNRLLYNVIGGSLAQLRGSAKSSIVERVETYVRSALINGSCSVESCAAALGVATRTLQKRLTRRGFTFLDIVQNERVIQAKQALLWSNSSLGDIAYKLGYSEQTSFGRAFKRATGMTPQAFRSTEKRRMASSGRAPSQSPSPDVQLRSRPGPADGDDSWAEGVEFGAAPVR